MIQDYLCVHSDKNFHLELSLKFRNTIGHYVIIADCAQHNSMTHINQQALSDSKNKRMKETNTLIL